MGIAGALQGAIGFGLSVLSIPILTIVNPVYTPAPGAIAGAWMLTVASQRTLGIVIGLMVLGAVAILASGFEVSLTRWNRVIAGTISGFRVAASGIGGPPIALLYRRQQGPVVRSTLGAIFTIGIFAILVILWLAGVLTFVHITIAAMLLPATFVGFVASGWLRPHVEGTRIKSAILNVSAFAAVTLLAISLTA